MNILSDVREFLTILSIYHSSFIIQKCFNWAYPTVSEYTLVVIEENLIDVSFNYDLEQKKKHASYWWKTLPVLKVWRAQNRVKWKENVSYYKN